MKLVEPPLLFMDWLDQQYPNGLPAAEEIVKLNQQYLIDKLKGTEVEEVFEDANYHESYYKITLDKNKTCYFPPEYFSGFDDKVFVINFKDLKNVKNPFVVRLNQNQGKLEFDGGDSDPFSNFANDLKRPLRIVVEAIKDGKKFLKTVYSAEQYFAGKEDDQNSNEQSHSDFVMALYDEIQLSQYGISRGLFLSVGQTYYQRLLYFIRLLVEGSLSEEYMVTGGTICSDLVLYRDGSVYLDLYQAESEIACTKIIDEGKYLQVPCPMQAVVRIPYYADEKVFKMPYILCNEQFLAFTFSNKEVLLEKNPQSLGAEKQAALEAAIQEELATKSIGADKLKRKPTQGKNKVKIIGGVAVSLFVVAGVVCFVFPGAIPGVLAAIGVNAGTDLAAAAVGAAVVGGATSLVGTGVTSAVYFITRAVIPRTLTFVMLEQCRIAIKDFEVIEYPQPQASIRDCGNHGIYLKADPASPQKDKEEEESVVDEQIYTGTSVHQSN